MASTTGILITFVCIVGLVTAVIAGAAYSSQADFRNQTDSFGTPHSQLENNTATAIQTTASGTASISTGILIFAGVIVMIVIMIAAYAATRKPKW